MTPLGRYFPLRGENRKPIGEIIGKIGNLITSTDSKYGVNLGNPASIAFYGKDSAIVLTHNWFGLYGDGEIRPFIYF